MITWRCDELRIRILDLTPKWLSSYIRIKCTEKKLIWVISKKKKIAYRLIILLTDLLIVLNIWIKHNFWIQSFFFYPMILWTFMWGHLSSMESRVPSLETYGNFRLKEDNMSVPETKEGCLKRYPDYCRTITIQGKL